MTTRVIGGGSAGAVRSVVEATTAELAADASENVSLTLAKSFLLMKVEVSTKARVRLYKTAAARTADAASAHGTYPTTGTPHGVIIDLYLDGSAGAPLAFMCSPDVPGSNGDDVVASTIYASVTNIDTSAHAVTATFTFVPLEN
jgi:hypothetical protein